MSKHSHLHSSCSHLLSSFGEGKNTNSFTLVITAPVTAVLTRQGHLSVSCLTSSRAQLKENLMSPGTVTCPRGLPAQDLCRPYNALQRGRVLSFCQTHQLGLNLGHPTMMHSAKNTKVLPPASFHPASIPPSLHFSRVGSPPSLVS